jgi:hypothetical protein
MRIRHTSRRRSDGGPPRPLDHAGMSLVSRGKYAHFYCSAATEKIIHPWLHGAAIEFDVDDETGRPHTIYLTRASEGQGVKLRSRPNQRPFLPIPTRAVGALQSSASGQITVEEIVISESEIAVKVPPIFTLRVPVETA